MISADEEVRFTFYHILKVFPIENFVMLNCVAKLGFVFEFIFMQVDLKRNRTSRKSWSTNNFYCLAHRQVFSKGLTLSVKQVIIAFILHQCARLSGTNASKIQLQKPRKKGKVEERKEKKKNRKKLARMFKRFCHAICIPLK